MNGATVRCKIPTRRQASANSLPVEPTVVEAPTKRRSGQLARRLALAHFIEARIAAGQLKDYAHAALELGLTRARLSQLVSLLTLSPVLQEQVMLGDTAITERELRRAAREVDWDAQRHAT